MRYLPDTRALTYYERPGPNPANVYTPQYEERATATAATSETVPLDAPTLLSVSGSTTPAGTLAGVVIKTFSGATTPAGAVFKSSTKSLAGGATPTGAVRRSLARTLTAVDWKTCPPLASRSTCR